MSGSCITDRLPGARQGVLMARGLVCCTLISLGDKSSNGIGPELKAPSRPGECAVYREIPAALRQSLWSRQS